MAHKLISSATMLGNVPVAKQKHSEDRVKFTLFGFFVFLVALPSTYTLNLVGELFLTELLLPILALLVIVLGKSKIFSEKLFWYFFFAGISMMIGYMISDLVAGTSSEKYLRAWGRNFLLFIDFISLAIIVGSDRRLIWWFVLGFSSGVIGLLVIEQVPISYWKLGYGAPTILLTIIIGCFIPKRILMVSILAIGVISVFLDSRSLGAFCMLVAAVIFIRLNKPSTLKLKPMVVLRILITGVLALSLLLTILNVTQEDHGDRRNWSNIGRFAAIRISIEAIIESPIIGYGSWGEGTEKFADQLYDEIAADLINSGQSNYQKSTLFLSHSQILQAWMEGGVFAAIFFILFGYQLFKGLRITVFNRQLDYATPLYFYLLLQSFWHLIMSPYSGPHRITIALSIAVLCAIRMEYNKR